MPRLQLFTGQFVLRIPLHTKHTRSLRLGQCQSVGTADSPMKSIYHHPLEFAALPRLDATPCPVGFPSLDVHVTLGELRFCSRS